MQTSRIQSIDFWRGVVLVTIFVDHVPGNPLSHLTTRNFGFSDAAEAFIFLSGLVLGYVSWPRLRDGRLGGVVWRCLKRAGQLYLVQVGLSVTAVVLFGLAFLVGGGDGMITADNRAFFFQHPGGGLLGLLLLSYQFGYFNILSVYVVLMVMAAGFFVLLARSAVLAFAISAALFVAARLGLMLPSWPVPYTWFLNPFAWQFLFLLGIGAGALRRQRAAAAFARACSSPAPPIWPSPSRSPPASSAHGRRSTRLSGRSLSPTRASSASRGSCISWRWPMSSARAGRATCCSGGCPAPTGLRNSAATAWPSSPPARC